MSTVSWSLMTFTGSNPPPPPPLPVDWNSKKGNYIPGIPDYVVAAIFQCRRLKFMVLEVLLTLYLSCRTFQLKGNRNVIFLKFQTTTRTIFLSQLRRILILDSNSGDCPLFEKSIKKFSCYNCYCISFYSNLKIWMLVEEYVRLLPLINLSFNITFGLEN